MGSKYIKIISSDNYIMLPKCFYTIGGEELSKTILMASGRIVKDVIGIRKIIEVEIDYMAPSDLSLLVSWIRTGRFFNVEYQDIDGATKLETFQISIPSPGVFKFKSDGTAVWHNVALTMTAREVI